MWGPPGTVYVYLSYGIHWCANIVTGPEGEPSAVLLRGGSVAHGVDRATQRRGRADHLADGPGKLAQTLGIDGSASGTTVWDGPVRLLRRSDGDLQYDATPRIGISVAKEIRWRFVEHDPTQHASSTIP
jgi:DNA-3-methyladenine glycosylase